jgi:hypothetical protein
MWLSRSPRPPARLPRSCRSSEGAPRCLPRRARPRPWRACARPRHRPRQANDRFIRDGHAPEELHDVEQREVVLPGAVVRARRLEADRLVKALYERFRDAALGGDVLVVAIEPSGSLDGGGVEKRDRERLLVHETHDGLGRKPGLRPRVYERTRPSSRSIAMDRSSLSAPSETRRRTNSIGAFARRSSSSSCVPPSIPSPVTATSPRRL